MSFNSSSALQPSSQVSPPVLGTPAYSPQLHSVLAYIPELTAPPLPVSVTDANGTMASSSSPHLLPDDPKFTDLPLHWIPVVTTMTAGQVAAAFTGWGTFCRHCCLHLCPCVPTPVTHMSPARAYCFHPHLWMRKWRRKV